MTVVALPRVPTVHPPERSGRAEVPAAALAALPLTAPLSPSERHDLAALLEVEHVGPGCQLVREGAAGFALVVVVEGTAVAERAGAVVGRVRPGQWVARLDGSPSDAGLRAETVLTAYLLDGCGLRELARRSPRTVARLTARDALVGGAVGRGLDQLDEDAHRVLRVDEVHP